MQENNQTPLIQTSLFVWYSSAILFFVVIGGIIWLYLSGVYTEAVISSTQEDIVQINKEIDTVSLDRKVLITQIIMGNTIRPSLDLKNIVTQFRVAAAKSGVGFQGFSIKDDTIATTLIATSGDNQIHPDPVATIIGMMREYATNNNLYFKLEPILGVSGDLTKRTTAIRLKVTPVLPKK